MQGVVEAWREVFALAENLFPRGWRAFGTVFLPMEGLTPLPQNRSLDRETNKLVFHWNIVFTVPPHTCMCQFAS